MKKIFALLICFVMVLSLCSCSGKKSKVDSGIVVNTNQQTTIDESTTLGQSETDEQQTTLVEGETTKQEETKKPEITTEKKQNTTEKETTTKKTVVEEKVKITIPASYYEDEPTNQAELSELKSKWGLDSATLNKDGSVTYVMSKSVHLNLLKELRKELVDGFNDLVGSEEYPNLTKIEIDDNFTEYKVYTKSEEVDLNEALLSIGLFTSSSLYHIYSNQTVDNVYIEYINSNTGKIIHSLNSSDLDFEEETTTEEQTTTQSIKKPTEKDIEIISEYTYADSIGWYTYHFVVVKNNYNKTVRISTSSLAYGDNGQIVGAADSYFEALGPGCVSVYYEAFETDKKIKSYDTQINVNIDEMYSSVIQDLSYQKSEIDDGIVFQVTNNGKESAEFVEGYALFFNNGKIVGFESSYFTDDDSEIKPGKTIFKQFNCYEEFDDVEFYLTGRRYND